MAKFNNSVAIQNILNGTYTKAQSTSKSRNQGMPPQFKTTAGAINLNGTNSGLGKVLAGGNATSTN